MRVLVVDDDPVCRLALSAMVRSFGHECLVGRRWLQAWRLLRTEPVDVLVADRDMPGIDGLRLCELVRSELTDRHVYVILATSLGSVDQARDGMRAGADDYLVKPTLPNDLELRLIAAERVTAMHRQARETHEELRDPARRDPLTGLGNRRSLAEDLVVVADQVRRYGQRCAVAMIDIDHSRRYNDEFGHQRGDEVLQAVARALLALSRVGDIVLPLRRRGVPLPLSRAVERRGAGRRRAAARKRRPARAARLAGSRRRHRHAERRDRGDRSRACADPSAAIAAADRAMYEAKRLGRNRVEIAAGTRAAYGLTG